MRAVTGFLHPTRYPVKPKAWTVIRLADGRKVARVTQEYPNVRDVDPACKGDADFSDDEGKGATPLRVKAHLNATCHSCPLLESCREWGLAHEEYGYWGGLSPDERRRVRIARGQALNYLDMMPAWFVGKRLESGGSDVYASDLPWAEPNA